MRRSGHLIPFLLILSPVVGLTGCTETPTAPEDGPAATLEAAGDRNGESTSADFSAHAGLNRDLAAVRRATAAFHDIGTAAAAGWDTPLTPCFEQLPDGAQGIHFGNVALIDDAVSMLEPEILLYEPQAGGHMRLVGVEYIVPLAFDEPAPLFGQHFHENEAAGVWALHLWNWRQNPSGTFADWNPKVSCEHAG